MDILIVDDVVTETKVLERILSKMGFQVGVAQSAKEALEYIINHHDIRMVIMNVMMPDLDGINATQMIRNKLYNPLSIVGYSSDSSSEMINSCFESGMNSFLSKPFQLDDIHQLLLKHNLKPTTTL